MSLDEVNGADSAAYRPTVHASGAATTSILVVVHIVASIAVLAIVFLLGMSVARCSAPALDCDFDLIANAQYLSYALVIVIAVAVFVGSIFATRRARRSVWIPVTGLIATAAIAAAFSILIYAATGQGLQI
jgi:hypothetical protein